MLVIAGVAIGAAIWYFIQNRNNNPANKNEQANQVNSGTVKEIPTPKAKQAAASQPTPANSADDDFRALSARRASATPQQQAGVIADLKAAENNYKEDYRFPYERAKLLVGKPPHSEGFDILSQATQKAIDSGKDKEMLDKLRGDSKKGAVFFPMSDHLEFGILTEALTKRNKDLLKKIAPSQ